MSATVFCLPYAGAGASAFHPLRKAAAGTAIDLRPVQLPGRERRIDEPLCTQLDQAADQLAGELESEACRASKVAVLGHSFGAVLGFEVTRRLVEYGAPVTDLFVSGCPGPWTPRPQRATGLDDDEFVAQVEVLAGYRHEALSHPRLRELLLPTLRADVMMHEQYRPPRDATVRVRITAIRGSDDELVSAKQIEEWRPATTGQFETVEFAGGHMYLLSEPDGLVDTVRERML